MSRTCNLIFNSVFTNIGWHVQVKPTKYIVWSNSGIGFGNCFLSYSLNAPLWRTNIERVIYAYFWDIYTNTYIIHAVEVQEYKYFKLTSLFLFKDLLFELKKKDLSHTYSNGFDWNIYLSRKLCYEYLFSCILFQQHTLLGDALKVFRTSIGRELFKNLKLM